MPDDWRGDEFECLIRSAFAGAEPVAISGPAVSATERQIPVARGRLAYLVNQYPKVSHTFIRREILELEAQGWEVERFSLRGWADVLPDETDRSEQARTHYLLQRGVLPLLIASLGEFATRPLASFRELLGVLRRTRPSLRPWPVHIVYWLEACYLARALRSQDLRHVHAHFGTNSAEVAMIAAALAEISFSFTVHGPEEFDRPEPLSLGHKAAQAAFVATISHYGRSQMMRWTPAAMWDKLKVVRCGLDSSFFPETLTAVVDTDQLVCVGRLSEQKGQLLLLDAIAAVVRNGRSVRLVLAGDGELRTAIEARCKVLGIEQHVHITGWIDSSEVARLILTSRALVLPSFAEGLPVVLMEALGLGRPVLTTYVAGIPELVIPGENGWLVPAGDTAALTEALLQLLDAPITQLNAMGARGRVRAEAMHDIVQQVAVLGACFADSLQSRRSTHAA